MDVTSAGRVMSDQNVAFLDIRSMRSRRLGNYVVCSGRVLSKAEDYTVGRCCRKIVAEAD